MRQILLIMFLISLHTLCDETPLELACRTGSVYEAQMLLANGAPINLQNEAGSTSLMIACKFLNEEIVDLLLEKSASVNVQNNLGESALFFAINNVVKPNNAIVRIVKKLLEHGADPNCIITDDALDMTPVHYTPLSIAVGNRFFTTPDCLEEGKACDEIIALLLAYNASPNRGDYSAFEYADIDTMKLFIAHGADVNYKDKNGDTPLHYKAMERPNKDKIKLLLEAGADPYIVNNEGKTALDHIANGDVELYLYVKNYKSAYSSKPWHHGFLVFLFIGSISWYVWRKWHHH